MLPKPFEPHAGQVRIVRVKRGKRGQRAALEPHPAGGRERDHRASQVQADEREFLRDAIGRSGSHRMIACEGGEIDMEGRNLQ